MTATVSANSRLTSTRGKSPARQARWRPSRAATPGLAWIHLAQDPLTFRASDARLREEAQPWAKLVPRLPWGDHRAYGSGAVGCGVRARGVRAHGDAGRAEVDLRARARVEDPRPIGCLVACSKPCVAGACPAMCTDDPPAATPARTACAAVRRRRGRRGDARHGGTRSRSISDKQTL